MTSGGAIAQVDHVSDYYDVAPVSINTSGNDFGGYAQSNAVYFLSDYRKVSQANELDEEGVPYLTLFEGTVENSSKWIDTEQKEFGLHDINLGPLCFVYDGARMYITANNSFQQESSEDDNFGIYIVEFGEKINRLIPTSINAEYYSVGSPAVSKDGKYMYFSSNMPGGFGGTDLYKSRILENGDLDTPVNLGAPINTEKDEMFPWLDQDGALYFSSNGHEGQGGLDIFVMLPNQGDNARLLELGAPINTKQDDFAFITKDGLTGYVSSNRSGGQGGDDIYHFTRNRPLTLTIGLEGTITDHKTNQDIDGAKLQLIAANGAVSDLNVSNSDGEYSFILDPEMDYTLRVSKEGYLPRDFPLSTIGVKTGEKLTKDATLQKIPNIGLFALVQEQGSSKPIEGVSIKLIDNFTGKEIGTFLTDATGSMLHPLEGKKIKDRISYNIEISKEGYVSSKQTFNKEIEKEGNINLHEFLDINLIKVDEGADLGKILDLNPIYFDLGRSNIRPDAALELDKIVKIMNENPNMVIELGAHTDSRGSAASNLSLSDKRAKASAAYIKERISNPDRISGKGFGETEILNKCIDGVSCSEAEHALNRRTEFKIVKM